MSKEKKIDQKQVVQMARDMCVKSDKPQNCKDCDTMWCKAHLHAFRAYKAGYREQTVGEWIVVYEYNDYRMRKEAKIACSVCGHKPKYEGYLSDMNYCPNCGAKMKGGAE